MQTSRMNRRKEVFRVSLEEIRDFVQNRHGEFEFTLMPEAAEFRKTRTMSG